MLLHARKKACLTGKPANTAGHEQMEKCYCCCRAPPKKHLFFQYMVQSERKVLPEIESDDDKRGDNYDPTIEDKRKKDDSKYTEDSDSNRSEHEVRLEIKFRCAPNMTRSKTLLVYRSGMNRSTK